MILVFLEMKAIPLDQVYFLEGPFGKADTVFRHYKMTARQIMTEFEDGKYPGFCTYSND